jgi:hypothetical protein
MTQLEEAWKANNHHYPNASLAFRSGWEAAMRAAENAIIDHAPPLNAELSMQGGAGPFTDPGMTAYVEGFHDAWATVSSLGNEHLEIVLDGQPRGDRFAGKGL